ncbi:Rha family transcriptional regulator [Campylobacter coli]|nr:hypothetical protein [Campylobacter coli]EAI8856437.1 hypothetical protein [Campylobacter coli]MBX1928332.1 Rha family transcriptional regulator [Campylobacter coli]
MSMWKINRQETEATSTNLVNINNKKVEFATKNNQIFCTSLDIARVFEKRHTHILDIIKNYLNDEDMKEFNQPNFRLVNYKDLKGELRPAYEVSRDGFSFKEFFENNFKSKLKEFNTKNNANKTIKNKDLEK